MSKRRQDAQALWANLDGAHAVLLTGEASTVVTLNAAFIQDHITRQLTKVRIELSEPAKGAVHIVRLISIPQPTGPDRACGQCDTQPCRHHWSLIEAATTLPGKAGALVMAALNLNDTELVPDTDVPGSDIGETFIFTSNTRSWEPAKSALTPLALPFEPATTPPATPELAALVPDPGSLRGAVVNEAACQQITNLSWIGRTVFLLAGPPGTGKSASLAKIAADRKVPHLPITSPDQAKPFTIGLHNGATRLEHSLFVQAVQHPCVIVLEDLHRWEDRLDVLDELEPLLNPSATRFRAVYPVEGGTVDVPIHPEALIAVTTNRPSVAWAGKWLDRWHVVSVRELGTNALIQDAVHTGISVLDKRIVCGQINPADRASTITDITTFANLLTYTIALLNRDPMLSARYSWGTRAAREAMTRFVIGQSHNQIAVEVFAGKLLRDPTLALHTLSSVHTLRGWGTPLISALPFPDGLTDEQYTEAFPSYGGKLA